MENSPIDHSYILKILENSDVSFGEILFISSSIEKLTGNPDQINLKNFKDKGTAIRAHKGEFENFLGTNSYQDLIYKVGKLGRATSKNEQFVDKANPSFSPAKTNIDLSNENFVNQGYSGKTYEFGLEFKEVLENLIPKEVKFKFEINNESVYRNYLSSKGLDITQKYAQTSVLLNLSKKTQRGIINRFEAFGGISSSAINLDNIEGSIIEILNDLKKAESAKSIKSGKYPCVLSEDMAWTLLHETIGHGSEADGIVTGDSFLSGTMGYKIADSSVSIIDDPHIKAGGWTEYDDEGVKATGTLIVEDGILSHFINSRKTAKMTGQVPSGNAKTANYLSPPIPRQTNTFIEPRDFENEELLEETKNGIYIGSAISAEISLSNGSFISFPQVAYKIENGELSNQVVVDNISGNALNCFSKVIGIGKSIKTKLGFCYKNDVSLPVGIISPQVAISEIEVL